MKGKNMLRKSLSTILITTMVLATGFSSAGAAEEQAIDRTILG